MGPKEMNNNWMIVMRVLSDTTLRSAKLWIQLHLLGYSFIHKEREINTSTIEIFFFLLVNCWCWK